jgi:prepilin-type processing-associated H-X9-DG protein
MKKRIIISESEKKSILSQHKKTINQEYDLKKQSLSEREMSRLINNVLFNEGLSVKNNNRVVLSEANWCNQNVCASQGYATGTCNYFGNGTGNCVFADGSVCGWTTASEDNGGEFVHWNSGPCGMSTQGGNRPSKLPKPTTTTPTAPTGKPKPISTSTTTTKTVKEAKLNEVLAGPASGNALNGCGSGSQLCWDCRNGCNGTGSGVYMGWNIDDQNAAAACGCTAWTFGMPLPQYDGRKLPKPTTNTPTAPTGKPKPVSNTTTTMKESIMNRLFRKVLSEMKNSGCETKKDCGGLPCVNGQCKNRTEVKELEGCFNPTCSCKSDKECPKSRKCIKGKCGPLTNREMKEDTELYERAGRVGDSCNCGTSHTAGVIKCGKMGAYYDCWCDCGGAQKDKDGDGYPG